MQSSADLKPSSGDLLIAPVSDRSSFICNTPYACICTQPAAERRGLLQMDGGRWAQTEATFSSLSQPLRSLSAEANNRVWLYLRGDKEKDAVRKGRKGGERPRSRVKPSQEIPPRQRGRLRSGRRKSDGGWSLATASASVRCVCATHATFSGAQSCQLTKRGNSLCCFPLRYLQRAPSCSAYNGEVLKHRNHANYFPGCNKAREKDSKAALKM